MLNQVAVNGQRTRIAMDISSAKEFHERLTEFCEFYSNLGIVCVLTFSVFYLLHSHRYTRQSRRNFFLYMKNNYDMIL